MVGTIATSAGLTILAEEARMLDDVKTEDVQAEMEATLLKIQSLDKDDSNRATLQEHYDYLESLKAALLH
jgi:F-type H+-transporting ATPase subunit epsilon